MTPATAFRRLRQLDEIERRVRDERVSIHSFLAQQVGALGAPTGFAEEWIGMKEAKDLTGVSRSKLRRMAIKDPTLGSQTTSSRWRFNKAKLLEQTLSEAEWRARDAFGANERIEHLPILSRVDEDEREKEIAE